MTACSTNPCSGLLHFNHINQALEHIPGWDLTTTSMCLQQGAGKNYLNLHRVEPGVIWPFSMSAQLALMLHEAVQQGNSVHQDWQLLSE